MKVLENNAKSAQIEARLNKYTYLSKSGLPGEADGRVLQALDAIKCYPDRTTNPNFHYWYILMRQFHPSAPARWIQHRLYHDNEDSLISEFLKLYSPKRDSPNNSTDQNPAHPEQLSPTEFLYPQPRNQQTSSTTEFDYTIDILVKDQDREKVQALRRLVEEYRGELWQPQPREKPQFYRILCRMQAAQSQQLANRVSTCIEYENIEIKKEKRAKKTLTLERSVSEPA